MPSQFITCSVFVTNLLVFLKLSVPVIQREHMPCKGCELNWPKIGNVHWEPSPLNICPPGDEDEQWYGEVMTCTSVNNHALEGHARNANAGS
jgi:hypothetical protein